MVAGLTRTSTPEDLAGDMYDEIEIRLSSAGRNEVLLSLLRELKPHDNPSLLFRWERAMTAVEPVRKD